MTKKPMMALAGMLLAGAAVTGGIMASGEDVVTPDKEVKATGYKAVMVVDMPAQYSEGPLKQAAKASLKASCPGGTVDTEDGLLCYADASKDAPAEKVVVDEDDLHRLVVCPHGVRWLKPREEVCTGGKVVATTDVKLTTGTMTDLVVQLKKACAPCAVSPNDWGQCPDCVLLEGGCASVCEVESEVK